MGSTEIELTSDMTLTCLVSRWALTIIFITILFLSIMQVGRTGIHAVQIDHWPIFLTHWGLTLNVIQAVAGACVITYMYSLGSLVHNQDLGILAPLYRTLHSTSTSISVFITFAYWFFIFDPTLVTADFVCIITHLLQSVIMLSDFLYLDMSYYFADIVYPLIVALLYIMFTILYYLFQGEDGQGNRYIYPAINWQRPKQTSKVVSTFITALILIYTALWITSTMKAGIRNLIRMPFRGKSDLQHIV